MSSFADPGVLDTLAVACAASGDFARALEVAGQAQTLAEERGQSKLADEIRKRIALYREERPWQGP